MKKNVIRPLLLTFLLIYALITWIPVFFVAPDVSAKSSVPPASSSSAPEASSMQDTSSTPDVFSFPAPEASSTPDGSSAQDTSSMPEVSPVPETSAPLSSAAPEASPAPRGEASFTLTDTAAGETFTVPEREFLMSAVACEMDLNSPIEALKAQAVAAYTYYSRQRQTGQPIACDAENWLVYVPESAMQARWGEDFPRYKALLEQVADEVEGQLLTYQGEPALCTYFAISPGSTEAVENVWSPDAAADHPYLQAVASPGDAFSDGYLSTADLTEEQFRAAVAEAFPEADLSGPSEGWLTELEYTPSGMVKTALMGGIEVSGGDLRGALGLRSACFTFTVDGEGFHFTVKGWGHGVGMSQAGAVFLAKRGADYKEILAHYYPGAQLVGG